MFDEYGISDVKKTLADAKFAITLDIDKLVGTEFIKKSDIIKTRTDVKKDVIGGEFGIKDVDIKKQNIDRYISKLSDVSGDKLDIGNFDTYFFRILGFKNILFKIINVGSDPRYRISKSLEDILNLNIKLVKAINKAKAKRGEYVEPKDEVALLSNSLKSYFKREMDVNRKNIDHLKAVESRCDEKHLVLLRSVEEISNVIYQKLKSLGKLESVDDAEILVEKIKTIENLIWNKRYEWSNFRINSISAIPGVPLATKNPDEIKRICNALKNVIEKV
jgi:DNA-binding transcriptional regulator GbsR (MarR family)